MPRISKTPGLVIAASVFMFAYGGLSIACEALPMGLAFFLDAAEQNAVARRKAALNDRVPANKIVSIARVGINFLLGFAIMISALGILKLNRAARFAAIACCLSTIFVAIAAVVYDIGIIFPAQNQLEPMKGGLFVPAAAGETVRTGIRFVGIAISIGGSLIFCVPVIIFLNATSVRAAFAEELPRDVDPIQEDDDAPRLPSSNAEPPPETGITDRP